MIRDLMAESVERRFGAEAHGPTFTYDPSLSCDLACIDDMRCRVGDSSLLGPLRFRQHQPGILSRGRLKELAAAPLIRRGLFCTALPLGL
jgi:hypothetical protein